MYSRHEISKLIAQTKKYSRGDADSIRRACMGFFDLKKDFENFRNARFPKAPDVNIYHFVQFLAKIGLAKKLPREADRFKLILNLSIQQQWSEPLKHIFSHTHFIKLKGMSQELITGQIKTAEIFKSIIRSILRQDSFEELTNNFTILDNRIKTFVTYYYWGGTIIIITYEKLQSKKNQIINYYLYMNNRIRIYNADKQLIHDEAYHPNHRAITVVQEPNAPTNEDRFLFPDFELNLSGEDFDEYINSIFQ